MKKKVSLPIVIAIVFIVAALVFTLAYTIAIKSMNKKLTDLNEKQQMFSNYAAVDDFLRENSFYKADTEKKELKTIEALVDSYDGRVLLLTAQEYSESEFSNSEFATFVLANGSRIVVLAEEQYKELATEENSTSAVTTEAPATTEAE
ncbi:MAG: hypothetical protein IKB72_04420 [Ruminococcus sp.]|nr:hypothetical protein [Ruminococcus sp.]